MCKDEYVVVWGGCSVIGLLKDMFMIWFEDGFFYLIGFGFDYIVLCS